MSGISLDALVAALRAVLALHTADYVPEEGLVCNECSTFETAREWPCPTVRAITAHIDTTPKENDHA